VQRAVGLRCAAARPPRRWRSARAASRSCLLTHRPMSVLPASTRACGRGRAAWPSRPACAAHGRRAGGSQRRVLRQRLQRASRGRSSGAGRQLEHALAGIQDGPVAGAAAQVARQVVGQLLPVGCVPAPGAAGSRPTATSRSPACRSRTASRGSRPSPAAPGAAAVRGDRSSTVNSALPSSVGRNWMQALTGCSCSAPARRAAHHHRACTAIALGAAFLGAGAARVLAQPLQHGARGGASSPRRRHPGGRSGSDVGGSEAGRRCGGAPALGGLPGT
jgi:hypothetical protein